jgi:hypothetical protein
MSYKYKNICTVQLKFSHKKTKYNGYTWGYSKIYQHYTSILSACAIYKTFKHMRHFLDNKYSSRE